MKKQFLFLLLLGLLCSIGNVWGTDKTYTFDDDVELATDWDVTKTVPDGGTGTCEITNSLNSFSLKNGNFLGLSYLNKSNIGITIVSKTSYSNITSISIDAIANDNSKPTIAAYIVTAEGDVEVFAAVGTKDGFATGGTNKWGNKTVDLGTARTGKLKIVTVASSSGKYAALDNIRITYTAAPASVPGTVEFSPVSGSSVAAESSINLSATGATSYKYKWTSSSETPVEGWSEGASAVVPAYGSENTYLHAYGVNATGDGAKSYATYTITAPLTPITPSLSYEANPLVLAVRTSATPTLTGNTGSGTVTYTSSEPSVATVNSSTGEVMAVAVGETTITATIAANGGYAAGIATATIKVVASPLGIVDQKLATGNVAWDASVIVTSDYTNISSLTALSQHGSATASGNGNTSNGGQTSKIGTASDYSDANYLEFSFTVAEGKRLNITAISIPVQPVSKSTNNFKAVLSDNQGSTEIEGTKTNLTQGTLANIDFASYGTLKGTITLRIYAWGWGDGYRLGKNIYITGTIQDDSNELTISTQPVDAEYAEGADPTDLTVAASQGTSPYTYQWYSCDDELKNNPQEVGTNSSSYTPSTGATGYYYCKVTDAASAEVESNVATITVLPLTAPTSIAIEANKSWVHPNTSVTITATVTGGVPAPTIKWWSCTDAEKTGAAEITAARGEETYSPVTTAAGTSYYYATASNTKGEVSSSVISITVSDPVKQVSGNSYYVAVGEPFSPSSQFICDDITMSVVPTKNTAVYTDGVSDNTIASFNSNFVASMAGNNNDANGWKASFTSDVNGILSVGVIINKNKTFTITNVESFSYEGKNGGGVDVSESVSGNSITTANEDPAKLYVIATISVESGTTYDFSVSGSKMGFYGFEFFPSSVSGTISAAGWSTFSSPYALDLSEAVTNGTVYFASASDGSTVTLEEAPSQIVRAGEGLMVKGTAGETFTIQTAGEAGTAISGNLLKGQTVTGNVSAANHYVFGYVTETPSTYGFYALTAETEVQAGKAYLEYPAAMAPSFLRIVEGEQSATGVENIEANEKAVKFIENGQLYILRDGVVYDTVGRVIRK